MSDMEDVDPVNEDVKLYQVTTSASSDNIDLIATANRTANANGGPSMDPTLMTPRTRTKTLAAATTSAASAIQHGHHPSSIPQSHPLSTKPIMTWSADDVATFLQILEFQTYATLSKEAKIHGPMLITLSNDSLLQLGITQPFHRQRLLMEIAAIKHQQSKANIMEDGDNGPDLAMLEVILSSVVKIFCTSTTPHYSQPWQMKRQSTSTSSGFVVRGKRIIGNAHGVTNQTSVRIRRHGDATKYVARVLWVAHECDLVLLSVDDDKFWTGLEPLEFGKVPNLQESVTVVGYPTGGDNISVTKGVVSRVVVSTYTHSGEALLTIQIDAAINSGNSGGPAMQGAQVVGVAFEALTQAQNIGYIIPVPVINHVLDDLDRHGKYTGFPRVGFNWQKLENESLRRYFKVADDVHGILVTSVEPLDGAAKVLKPDDVITAIDGISVADDGTIFFRRGERLSFRFIETSKFNGDKLKFTLLRNGQPMDVDVMLQARESLVPLHLHDQLPQYFVHAGLVFTVLSRAYMYHEWGKNWQTKAPVDLVQLAYYGLLDQRSRQIVILSQVLVDDVNNSYNAVFHNLILKSVDGVEVTNLRHLVEMVEKAENAGTPFLRFNLERDKVICLDTKLARESTPRILKQNNIEYAKSVDLRSPL